VKKVFCRIRFLGYSPWNFTKIRSDFCKNRVFQPEIRFLPKFFCKHFRNVHRSTPMGWGVRIPFFSKIGNLRNFSLYTAKIVFFGHTPIDPKFCRIYLSIYLSIWRCLSFSRKLFFHDRIFAQKSFFRDRFLNT
jgi:hypothetical protein